MTNLKRINNILIGLAMILVAICFLIDKDDGYIVIIAILAMALLISAVKELWYYFTMARFMVSGTRILIKGILKLDLGIFTATLNDVPEVYVMLYLIAVIGFKGCMDIFSGLDAQKVRARIWIYKIVSGIIHIVIAIICVFNLHNQNDVVIIYSAGMIISACTRIWDACRKTAIVYIQ